MQVTAEGINTDSRNLVGRRVTRSDHDNLAIAKLAELNQSAQIVLSKFVEYQSLFFTELSTNEFFRHLDKLGIYAGDIVILYKGLAKKEMRYFIMLVLADRMNMLKFNLRDYVFLEKHKARNKNYKFSFDEIEDALEKKGYEFYPDETACGG